MPLRASVAFLAFRLRSVWMLDPVATLNAHVWPAISWFRPPHPGSPHHPHLTRSIPWRIPYYSLSFSLAPAVLPWCLRVVSPSRCVCVCVAAGNQLDESARPASQSAVGGLGSRFLLVRGPGFLCVCALRSRVCV